MFNCRNVLFISGNNTTHWWGAFIKSLISVDVSVLKKISVDVSLFIDFTCDHSFFLSPFFLAEVVLCSCCLLLCNEKLYMYKSVFACAYFHM
jgi:hypothetical protein